MNQLNPENFFEQTGGNGAPSLKMSAVNDGVIGEVLDTYMAPAKVYGKDIVKKDEKTGEDIMQLVVILQTDYRNWDRVAKAQKNEDGTPKDPSLDDGRRAVYIEPWTNIHAAVGKAIREAQGGKPGPVQVGARLGLKIIELRDTNKGNPLKVFAGVYTPPAAGAAFFNETAPATQAPAPSTPTPAPATQAPAPEVVPAGAVASAPVQQDPWASQGVGQGGQASAPPF